MTHTMAAVFEQRADAERALEALVQSGFGRETVRLGAADEAPAAVAGRPAEDHSISGEIRAFFDDLFRDHHADRHLYAEAVKRGHVVLTIAARSHDEAERAADIIEAFGPLDLDREQIDWGAGGWTGSESGRAGVGTVQAGVGSMQSAQGQSTSSSGSRQGLSAQGALQRGDPLVSDDPLGADLDAARRGARIYPRDSGEPNQGSLDILRGGDEDDSDDLYFRSHWQTTLSYAGGTYQEFDPAYRYGASMAGSSAYHDLPWEQAESELRTTWEHAYPQSAWDKFKDAVREGWNRVVH